MHSRTYPQIQGPGKPIKKFLAKFDQIRRAEFYWIPPSSSATMKTSLRSFSRIFRLQYRRRWPTYKYYNWGLKTECSHQHQVLPWALRPWLKTHASLSSWAKWGRYFPNFEGPGSHEVFIKPDDIAAKTIAHHIASYRWKTQSPCAFAYSFILQAIP